ncbi:CoA ester lyase [Selenomonadales bacterium OttesenSCG-928-I06]|nr:CoA ester lyase [Selenomonadales bacterium OttesenSCG-928-I06]
MIIRSIIFVPGNKEKMLTKSLGLGGDALVWDVEDAVPLAEKDLARATIGKALDELPADHPPIYVRINPLPTNMLSADLNQIVKPDLYGVMLAKAEYTSQVVELDTELSRLELANGLTPGSIKIHCILETCLGIINAYELATASSRVDGVSFGAEDFTLDLGTSRSRDGIEQAYARGAVTVAAAAAKVMAIDTVYSDLNDEEGLIKESQNARQIGFTGKFALHPKQVAPINQAFSPSEKEVEYATKVVAAFKKAEEENLGVITVDGRMVDPPVVKKAQQILEAAGKNI